MRILRGARLHDDLPLDRAITFDTFQSCLRLLPLRSGRRGVFIRRLKIQKLASAIPSLLDKRSAGPKNHFYRRSDRIHARCRGWLAWCVALCALLPCFSVKAAGVWRAVLRSPPAGVSSGVLLGDGTVICADGGTGWYRLTPDTSGNFANGTWTTLAKMHDSRLFCATQVLTNGNVFECGGEDGTGHGKAEMYDPLANVWDRAASPRYWLFRC